MLNNLRLAKFEDVDLSDEFFDSLREDYVGFNTWYNSKLNQNCYVVDNVSKPGIRGFLYLKVEDGEVGDVVPVMAAAKRLKIGTLKIIAHGTKLGERVLKKAFDTAIAEGVSEIYVTIFPKHVGLIKLFERYGFSKCGMKDGEIVFFGELNTHSGDIIKDYPHIALSGHKCFLLAIYPEYHTKLFPDSILHNEDADLVQDISYTNTIHKVYIAKMPLTRMKRGDIVIMYRTTDRPGQARFRSVITSICVVEEVRKKKDFSNLAEFLKFSVPHSVFSVAELRKIYADPDRHYIVRMTYNAAFTKRVIRDKMLDLVGITEQPRWDLRELTEDQVRHLANLGVLNANIIVD
ncbi:N-acetyltransferase [Methylobacterium sp. J-078]|uniref:N-acetyltransferase n=1 Tax=Methylobacterium sp. J-078 TaxID=2836657 RepID=UPI001FBBEA73|nr:N-acetyltransferase [Methylobacterium sp. J-078]MCJ2044819.1 N-acetyltransferase [Methylobacterium sp. J-078]